MERNDLQEMRKMVAEVKKIEIYENELIESGKLPASGFSSDTCEFSAYLDTDHNELEIADEFVFFINSCFYYQFRIIARYLRIIEFY